VKTLIIRHRRENLKKCSLRGLEGKEGYAFLTYPKDPMPNDLSSYFVLALGAPVLSEEDKDLALLLIDGTWRLASRIQKMLPAPFIARSLPMGYLTAYPRRQEDCSDPTQGLASIEALYLAHKILGRPLEGLLDNYHWRDLFLERNRLV